MTKPNVREIRIRLKMSQSEFAETFGLNLSTLRQWEQGRKHPSGTAQSLLVVIAQSPDAVANALKARPA